MTAIVTEWAEKGSLKSVLTNRAFKLDWPLMMKWALQVAFGLDYLHTRSPKIIHRGIKFIEAIKPLLLYFTSDASLFPYFRCES